ncbi:MAG TPA: AAA family ATPase [Candidatus Saccharimonadales bacterium]|nr:AAA family ATPase [Candidatus Saccharimonadales bacterium]
MKPTLKLIGVAGTAGAGKDTVSDMIARQFAMPNLSTSDIVRAITRHVYSLPHDFNPVRDQLYVVANFLRNEVNPATMVKLCILMAQVRQLQGGVISGLRSIGEAEAIRDAGGIIVGVDAEPKIRYERISARHRDTETLKTFEEFLKQDEYENRGLSDQGPSRGIRAIIDSADVLITNAMTIEELEQEVKNKIAPLLVG